MERKYKCNVCNKTFAEDWAKGGHERLCRERAEAYQKYLRIEDNAKKQSVI